jgi:NAD(P)-dependent dehydrogenase (short-subunit alcohol dehydrogenase family)
MDRLLEGKIALITGASGGLGTDVTRAFLDAGAKVIGVSRSIQSSSFDHPAFTAMPADISKNDAARTVAASVTNRFGRIDALVHVMGGFDGGKSVAETDDATLETMLDLNYRAAFYIARAVIPQMRKQRSGRIVAVASRQATEPAAGVGAYSASKAALVSLVQTIALENKDAGISANAVMPATMNTPGNPSGEWVKTSQVAALLVYLLPRMRPPILPAPQFPFMENSSD